MTGIEPMTFRVLGGCDSHYTTTASALLLFNIRYIIMERDMRVSKKKKSPGPIEQLFLFMEKNLTVEIWTEHNPNLKFQGKIIGFDEWMNLTLDQAQEINVKKGTS